MLFLRLRLRRSFDIPLLYKSLLELLSSPGLVTKIGKWQWQGLCVAVWLCDLHSRREKPGQGLNHACCALMRDTASYLC